MAEKRDIVIKGGEVRITIKNVPVKESTSKTTKKA